MSFVSRVFVLLLVVALAACSPPAQAPISPSAIIGTRAIIKRQGQEMVAEITAVTGKLVTTEFQWQGGSPVVRNYYRGLFPVSGRGQGYQFDTDFEEAKLEKLFPLVIGKETGFHVNSKDIERGTAADIWVNLSVVAQKIIDLPSGPRQVFVVDIVTQYTKDNQKKRKINTVYFDPELAMVLKSVMLEEGYQSFWSVVMIERPGEGVINPAPVQQRRSGTVMI